MSADHYPHELHKLKQFVESDEPLFACDSCQRVGFEVEAIAHKTLTGHDSVQASDEEALEARTIWRNELKAKGIDVK